MSPLIPILVLLAGATLIAVGASLRFRYTPVLQALAATLASIALIWAGRSLPHMLVLLAWRPVSLFGMPVVLNIDGYAWGLSLSWLAAVLAASLRRLAQPDESPFYPALLLAMSAVMLAVVGAANVLTLALAWGFLDVACCMTLLAGEGQAGSRRAEWVIGVNGVATLSVWIALIFLERDNLSSYWHLMTWSPGVRMLLGLAAVLRLGMYPLHAWTAPHQRADASQAALLNLMPMTAGLALWIRLAAVQAAPVGDVWVWAALAGALLAGLLAWVQPDARQSIPYVAIGYAGVLVVAGNGAGLSAVSLTQGAATWLLAIYVLAANQPVHLAPVVRPGWRLRMLWGWPALAASVALVGLPATAGMAYRLAMHAGLSQARWLWWGLAVLAEISLAGAALRGALAPYFETAPDSPVPAVEQRTRLVALVASLIAATLPLVIFGVWPAALFGSQAQALEVSRTPGPALDARGWAGWSLPMAGMSLLLVASVLKATGRVAPGSARLQSYLARASQLIRQMLDLGWLYDLMLDSLRRGARLIGHLAALTEGKAALVWMLLFIVLALLYLGEPGS